MVISIISLLIAILLPALSSARKTARNVICQTNLHAMMNWTYSYASDNKDYLPSDGRLNGWTEISTTTWYSKGQNAKIYGGFGTKASSPMICPEALSHVTVRDGNAGITYGMNVYLGGKKKNTGTVNPTPTPRVDILDSRGFIYGEARPFKITSDPGKYDFHRQLAFSNFSIYEPNMPWTMAAAETVHDRWESHGNFNTNFAYGDGHASGLSQDAFKAMYANAQWDQIRHFIAHPDK